MLNSLKMLVLTLCLQLHAHPDKGVITGMIHALAAEDSPILGSLAEDATALVLFAEHESRMQLHPKSYSWDSKAGLSHGIWQLQGLAGETTPEKQATSWLALLRDGVKTCPQSPAAPLRGGCMRARKPADREMMEVHRLLTSILTISQ